jgi:SAM-dependent methyltransferase
MPEQDGQKSREPIRTDADPSMASAGHDYAGDDLEALADLPAYQEWILHLFRPHLKGKVVEIGAGLGNIASRYADGVDDLLLVEPAKNLYPRLKERFDGKPNVRTICALVESLDPVAGGPSSIGGAPFDAALLVNVLEHVADHAAMLRSIRRILGPEGKLLVFVPALPWLYGTLDKKVGHQRRYTLPGLVQVVEQAAFVVETIRYFDFAGVLPWYFAGRVSRSGRFSDRAAKLYDRLVVPIARTAEKYLNPPIGKNLLCIARPLQRDESVQHRGAGNAPTS